MLAFLNISDSDKTIITIVTVVLSTFALVMSLLIALLRYEYREDNYQQCGRELENLNQRLKIRINEIQAEKAGESDVKSPKDDDMQYLGEYNDILRRFNLNHSEFDYCYSLMKAENDKLHAKVEDTKVQFAKLYQLALDKKVSDKDFRKQAIEMLQKLENTYKVQ